MSVENSLGTGSHSIVPQTIPKLIEAAYPTRALQAIPVELLAGYPKILIANEQTVWADDSGLYMGPRRYPVSVPPPVRDIEKAVSWLESMKPFAELRAVWRGCQEVKWLCEIKFGQYVSAGSLLTALSQCGIAVRPEYVKDSPNYEIRVPSKWMKWLELPSLPIQE
jgi:hypothetical protein